MAEFADRMKSFTDHLHESIEKRGEALAGIHAATGELLGAARSFLGDVAEEHRERAEELRATLASHRAACCQTVAEMRHGHQQALHSMRDQLQETLSETRRMRHDTNSRMFQSFRHARHLVAADLRAAADTWRAFAATR